MNEALENVVSAEVGALGFELFGLRVGGSRARPVIDVRIDRPDGGAVTVDDCAAVSRALQARLDADGALGERYVLEVSSPGLERPLRHAGDWRRFVGRWASVLSPELHGREEVEILAVEGDAGREIAHVRDARGTERRIALADVKDARLAFHWE